MVIVWSARCDFRRDIYETRGRWADQGDKCIKSIEIEG